MLLIINITKKRKKALLSFYPGGIKQFVEKTISDTADRIIIERENSNIEKELAEYHNRRVLNNYDPKRRKMTQETKNKISKAQKGKHTGWHQFPETIEKIRLANVGKHSGPNIKARGKKRTKGQRQNISKAKTVQKYKKHVKIESN